MYKNSRSCVVLPKMAPWKCRQPTRVLHLSPCTDSISTARRTTGRSRDATSSLSCIWCTDKPCPCNQRTDAPPPSPLQWTSLVRTRGARMLPSDGPPRPDTHVAASTPPKPGSPFDVPSWHSSTPHHVISYRTTGSVAVHLRPFGDTRISLETVLSGFPSIDRSKRDLGFSNIHFAIVISF